MIIREKYLKEIRPFFDSDLVKIITGIRRSGKSVILKTIYDEISRNTPNTIFLDFEDANDLKKAGTVDKLLDYIDKTKKVANVTFF